MKYEAKEPDPLMLLFAEDLAKANSKNRGLKEALRWIIDNFDSDKSGLTDDEYHKQMLKIAKEALSR